MYTVNIVQNITYHCALALNRVDQIDDFYYKNPKFQFFGFKSDFLDLNWILKKIILKHSGAI